jgi:hypothetical protein
MWPAVSVPVNRTQTGERFADATVIRLGAFFITFPQRESDCPKNAAFTFRMYDFHELLDFRLGEE